MRFRRPVARARCAAAALALSLSAGGASAGWIEICNRGSADIGFLDAQGHAGLVSSIRQRVAGFVSLPRGDCITQHREPYTVWSIAYVARDSGERITPIDAGSGAGFSFSAPALAGPTPSPAFSISSTGPTAA